MSAETVNEDISQTVLRTMQRLEHPQCFFCNGADSLGIELDWQTGKDGDLRAKFCCDDRLQSYGGVVHGGVISLLFDGAMTNCLFARGTTAVTGELTVRYLDSVPINSELQLIARIVKSRPPLFVMEADLRRQGVVLARASGKFMEKPPEE